MNRCAEDLDKFFIPEPNSGCFIWTAAVDGHGYGAVSFGGTMRLAHRVYWMLTKGEIPDGMFLLHKCDNPLCINPDHLFPGTQKDNMRDKVAKGRSVRGEKIPSAKLTAEGVLAILADKRPQVEIAKAYGVHYNQIWCIKHGLSWAHLTKRGVPQ